MQAPLHQGLRPLVADERHRPLGGGMTMGHVDQLEGAEIDVLLVGEGDDLLLRANENGLDQAALGRFHRALQRVVAAGVADGRRHGRQSGAALDQVIEMLGADERYLWHLLARAPDLARRYQHLGAARNDEGAIRVDRLAVEDDGSGGRPLLDHGDRRGDLVVGAERPVEDDTGCLGYRAEAGQLRPGNGREQGRGPHRLAATVLEHLVDVEVAGEGGPTFDVIASQNAGVAGGIADRDFIEGLVLDHLRHVCSLCILGPLTRRLAAIKSDTLIR